VHETHGTTRDTIEERIDLRGVPMRLIDTAGFRAPENPIEHEGIERSRRSLEIADVRIHIVDASAPQPDHFATDENEILVSNKCDLPEHGDWKSSAAIRISCKSGDGLPALEEEIFQRFGGGKLQAESPRAINARHREQLARAGEAIDRALAAMDGGATPEMFAIDLREAQHAFDELLGAADEEAVRDSVFRQFCIGK
jgi:tRNA modification GTPase